MLLFIILIGGLLLDTNSGHAWCLGFRSCIETDLNSYLMILGVVSGYSHICLIGGYD